MIRGTTPLLEFELPFEIALLEVAYITFSQKDKVILEKTLEDCEIEGTKLRLKLSQEDTLAFEANYRDAVEIQIRAKTLEGEALASNIRRESPHRILKDGVI